MHLMWCDLQRDKKKTSLIFSVLYELDAHGTRLAMATVQAMMLFLGADLCLALSYVNNGMAGLAQFA